MLLGSIFRRLEDQHDAAAALEALSDIVLLTEVTEMAMLHDESPGEYASGAARRFANSATDEDWLGLVTAMERSDDPARTMLDAMVRWSLRKDRQSAGSDCTGTGSGECFCGRQGSHHDHVQSTQLLIAS